MSDCNVTMRSGALPKHTHRCSGKHQDGMHWCANCLRWFWERPKK